RPAYQAGRVGVLRARRGMRVVDGGRLPVKDLVTATLALGRCRCRRAGPARRWRCPGRTGLAARGDEHGDTESRNRSPVVHHAFAYLPRFPAASSAIRETGLRILEA